jgi:ubiquinone/menaquinone biosynthesis C-methylase UbiE
VSDSARFVGSVPELYDRHLGPVMFDGYAGLMAQRLAASASGPALEIACGTGISTAHVRRALPVEFPLTATDLNPPMLAIAEQRFADVDGITFQQADAQALPFEDGAFDSVACQFGVMFFPDKAKGFAEMRRVLQPGGTLVFNVWDERTHNRFAEVAHSTLSAVLGHAAEFYNVPFGFHDATMIHRMLDDAGFGDSAIEWIELPQHAESAESLSTGLVMGNPIAYEIVEQSDVSLEAARDSVTAALIELGGERPFQSTMRALMVSATAR